MKSTSDRILGRRLLHAGLACAGVILLVLTLGPREAITPLMPFGDGPAHVVAFFLVTCAVLIVLPRASRLQAAGLALGFGVVMELVQALVGRGAEIDDLLANMAGITIAVVLWFRRRLV